MSLVQFLKIMIIKMYNQLDNPVWNALMTGNKSLAKGDEGVKYFSDDISPFIGVAKFTYDALNILHYTLPPGRVIAIFTDDDLSSMGNWIIKEDMHVIQMIYEENLIANELLSSVFRPTIRSLVEKDVNKAITLTSLTHPGPFLKRTIEFGNYEGIFYDGKLVAMAGQRLRPYPYVEVSAVCTHPAYRGRGFASILVLRQVEKIINDSHIPFLHVRANDKRTMGLYERLGFRVRKILKLYFIKGRL